MSIMMIIEEDLPLAIGGIVNNLFRYYIHLIGALACDKSVHFFIIIVVLFCAVANQVPHLT
jgi:hypothetical protein